MLVLAWLASAEAAPVAEAGGPYETDAGAMVTLDASASTFDWWCVTTEYAWDFDEDGEADSTEASPTFDASALDGPLAVEAHLTVAGWCPLLETSPVDVAVIYVNNVAPQALKVQWDGDVLEGSPVDLIASFADVEGADTHAVTWDLPGGDADGARVTTTFPDDGPWVVHLTVADDDGGATQIEAEIPCENVDPVVLGRPDEDGEVGQLYTFAPSVEDAGEDDTHVWTAELPAGADVDAATGVVSWTPSDDQEGVRKLVLTVTDDDGGAARLTWDVAVAGKGQGTDSDGDGEPDGNPVVVESSGECGCDGTGGPLVGGLVLLGLLTTIRRRS